MSQKNDVVFPQPPAFSIKNERLENFHRFGTASLLFAGLYILCLYQNPHGILYPIFMGGTLYLMKRMARIEKYTKMDWFYTLSLMVLSIFKCMFLSGPMQLADTLAIGSLWIGYILHIYTDMVKWSIGQKIAALIKMTGQLIVRCMQPLFSLCSVFHTLNFNKKEIIFPIVIGLMTAFPLVAIILVLLTSADAVFDSMVQSMVRLLFIPEDIGNILQILLTFIAMYILFFDIHMVVQNVPKKQQEKRALYSSITAITTSSVLAVVYIAFSCIQFLYLFIGNMKLPDGYTYAQYVHEGFYELLAVSIINLVLVLICKGIFKPSRILNGLLTIICLCTGVMIASSALRMSMYIQSYHLTFLRLFVLWFLFVLSIWIVLTTIHIYRSDFPLLRYGMIAITLCWIGFHLIRPEYQIARYDLSHRQDVPVYSDSMDAYLLHLSEDAVDAFDMNSAIGKEYARIHTYQPSSTLLQKIRTFNFSQAHANRIFQK